MITNSTPESLIKLKSNYDNLNTATRKVADYILKNPHEIVETDIVTLAEKIEVSSFSIINCIKSVGYDGFRDFKMELAKGLGPQPTNFLYDDIDSGDDSATILKKIFQKKIQFLNDTLKLLKEKEFEKAVKYISEANKIEVYAIGYSAFAAEFCEMNIRRLEKNIVSYSDSHYQNISASLLKEDDLAIAVSTSGKSNCVVRSLKIAKSNGARTIAITSNQNSPLTEHADITLLTTYSEPLLLKETNSSIVEQMTLVSALTIALAMKDMPHAFISLSQSSSIIGEDS